jgi:membrane-bound lytic murein transglycosylase D
LGHPCLKVSYLIWGLTLITILTLGGCGGTGGERQTQVASEDDKAPRTDFGASQTFPVPSEIQPNVDFWRHVYGIWSRSQVAFHDDEHMGVIYEVVHLPGFQTEGYNQSQKAWVSARAQYHADRVRELERRVTTGQTLSPQDKELLAKFEQSGGTRALYGAADRVRSQRGMRERFRRGLEISGRYDQAFREVMRANGVPEDLAYLPHVESSFQTNARSSVGAAGVWQFMPATGRLYMNVNGAVDDRLDPILASQGAARYLAQAHAKLHSWPLAITSYNHGQGGMANAKAMYGNDIGRIVKDYQGKAFKFASRNFYSEFVAAREVARNANRYFPEGVRYESPWPHDRVVLQSTMPAHHLASHYDVSTGSLASLNLHWRDAARDSRAHLPAGTTVWLPAGTTRRVASQPPPYAGSVMIARTETSPRREPVTTSAAALAFKAVGAEPANDPLSAARPARTERAAPKPGPRVAGKATPKAVPRPVPEVAVKAEPKAAKSEHKVAAKAEPKVAKPEPKVAAKSESKAKDAAKSTSKAAKVADKGSKGDKTKPTPDTRTAKAEKTAKAPGKASASTKVHVVKPQETLFRVASQNGISVAELRKLNKLGPGDNSIRPGQKLKVGS